MSDFLHTPIEFLKGVGNIKADILKKELEIFTFGDLLMHVPFRYVDKTKIFPISDVSPDFSYVQIKGRFMNKEIIGQNRAKRLVAEFSDGSGTIVTTWFTNFQWIEKGIDLNKEYILFGKPGLFKNTLQMNHPEMEMVKENTSRYGGLLEPVYHTSEKLKSRGLDSKGISNLIKALLSDSRLIIEDYFSETIIQKFRLPNRKDAIHQIHFPQNENQYKNALYRLKFEEIFMLQYKMLRLKNDRKHTFAGYVCDKIGHYFNTFFKDFLPFELSNAQKKVIKEIRDDMGSGKQMNRLLMGDVGSGKTIVAFFAALISTDNQLQTCLMAPTEILARQHFEGLGKFAEMLNLKMALLTGSTKLKERKILFEQLENGEINLLIGTHALIESSVQFQKLGLVIIDEQHRFGVEQRSKLWNKNEKIAPHILVMSATPIPRTLALTIYGDLDTSIIDELPKGRIPIKTTHQYSNKMPQIVDFCKTQISEGRQVYVVFPLIEESETLDLKALEEGVEELKHYFPPETYKTSMVHGKLKAAEKEKQMMNFKNHLTQIMVATTVIEVGVDVPNASVMLIENAERFGLTQLHQLRGRVGRGANQSYCILISGNKLSEDARIRLDTMCRTNNGFEIAEVDLKLRGHGDIYGTRQSGIIGLKLTEITRDGDLIAYCRDAVKWLLNDDINLLKAENQRFKNYYFSNNKNKNWFNIS